MIVLACLFLYHVCVVWFAWHAISDYSCMNLADQTKKDPLQNARDPQLILDYALVKI